VTALLAVVAARLGQAVGVALVLATLCFAFTEALPGDTALRIAAARVGLDLLTPERAERVRAEAGLERPMLQRYGAWMAAVAQGDLGRSLVSGRPVTDELRRRAAVTLQLGALGWALAYLIALPLGIRAGLAPGGRVDRATATLAAILASLPPFLVGVLLVSVFALALRWLPPAGYGTFGHLVLPALSLALGLAAYGVRIVRNATAEVQSAFYVTYAQTRGYGRARALRRHGVRNAAIPVVTFAALQFAMVVDGFVVIETLFNVPGLGRLLVDSLLARDVPMILGAALLIGFAYAFVNLVADLLCLALDPRQRAGAWR